VNSDSNPEETPKLRDRLRKATSDAILDAAEGVLSQGVHAARMEDVAARAGVSVGTLYNYFADRGALIEALLLSRREALMQRLDQALADVERESFSRQLERFMRELFAHFEEHRRFFSILLQGELGIRKHPAEALRAIHARVELLVRRGTQRGELRAQSAAVYPALLMGMARGLILRTLFEASDRSVAADVPELVRVFLHGAAKSE